MEQFVTKIKGRPEIIHRREWHERNFKDSGRNGDGDGEGSLKHFKSVLTRRSHERLL